MKLTELIKDLKLPCLFLKEKEDVEIKSIESDSRKVKEGSLFIAIEGYLFDGHNFVENAIEMGASVVIINENKKDDYGSLKDVTVLYCSNTRKVLSEISAKFYGEPTKDLLMIGVTGTNGKTSITYMIESILKEAGFNTGIIGTINYRWNDNILEAPNTTPDSRDLQELIGRMKNDGVDGIVMEVSSHALYLNRVDDINFDGVIFTNLTPEHLDFHKNLDDYFSSKKRLFDILKKSSKKNRVGAVNLDNEFGKKLIEFKNYYNLVGYSIYESADYRVLNKSIIHGIDGIEYEIENLSNLKINLQLAGKFHVYNSLSVIALLRELGIAEKFIVSGLKKVKSIPGRFEKVKSDSDFDVIIDYAHTPDALLNLLNSVKDINHSRVITLFGCGGDRDKAKRPLMGKIATENSDKVIITSDNPRNENPEKIIEDILEGIENNNYEIIVDREEAIRMAVKIANKGDIVLIAGKGHENYQIIGNVKKDFDDYKIAEKFIVEVNNES